MGGGEGAGKFDDVAVFPGNEHERAVQGGGFEAPGERAPIRLGDIGLDGHGESDGGWLDGGERADVVVLGAVIGFWVAGVRGEDDVGFAEIAADDGGQGEGAVEALTIELAEPVGGFFGVAQEHDCFGVWRRGVRRRRGGPEGEADATPS